MKSNVLKLILAGLGFAVSFGTASAQTLTFTDDGGVPPPTGIYDISQLNDTDTAGENGSGINYYDNNSSDATPGASGQSFTTGNYTGGYVLTNLAIQLGGNTDGGNDIGGPQGWQIELFILSGTGETNASMIYSNQTPGTNDGFGVSDWLGFSGMAVPLSPSAVYAYTIVNTVNRGSSYDDLAYAAPESYSGGAVCRIPSPESGSTLATFYPAVNVSAAFDVGLGLQGPPYVGAVGASPDPAYALSSVTLSGVGTGTGTVTYSWQTNSDITGNLAGTWGTVSGATSTNVIVVPPNLYPSGPDYTLDYRLIVSDSQGSVTSAPLALVVMPASKPVIVEDTTPSSVFAYTGGSFTLSATFSGDPTITYQWQRDSGNTGTFTNITAANVSGATTTTLTVNNTTAADNGNYRLVAVNGQGTTISTPASVTLVPLIYLETFTVPTTGDQPIANAGWINDIVGNNNTRLYTGGTNGAVYSYDGGAATEAFYVTTVSENGSLPLQAAFPSIPLATTGNLTLFVDFDSTYNPQNATGYFAVEMNFNTWYVSTTPLGQPDTSGNFFPQSMVFNPSAASWDNLTVSGTGTVNTSAVVGGAASANLSGNITGAGMVIVHIAGGGTINFDNFAIAGTVENSTCPVFNAPPFSTTNYTGSTVILSVSASSNGSPVGLTYQWKAGTVGSGVYANLANSAQYSGVTSDTLVISNITSAANQKDYVVEVSDNACSLESTPPATLTVIDSAPLLVEDTTITPATNIIAGNNNIETLAAAFAGDQPITYQWQYSPNSNGIPASNIAGATSSNLTLTQTELLTSASGYYSLQARNSRSSSPTNSSWAQLTILSSTNAEYTWQAPVPFDTLTALEILSRPLGTFAEAEVFNGGGVTVTEGGVDYIFDSTGTAATLAGTGGPGTSDLAFTGNTGDTNLNAVLSEEQEDENTPAITLNNLIIGVRYSAQLFALDDTHDRTRLTAFGDPNDTADVSQSYTVGSDSYIIGTFTATNTTAVIDQVLANGHGYMGSVIVRSNVPPTLSLLGTPPNMLVFWDYGTLLQATSLSGPWTRNANPSPVAVSTSSPTSQFFKVVAPAPAP